MQRKGKNEETNNNAAQKFRLQSTRNAGRAGVGPSNFYFVPGDTPLPYSFWKYRENLVFGCGCGVGILDSTFPSIIEENCKSNLEKASRTA